MVPLLANPTRRFTPSSLGTTLQAEGFAVVPGVLMESEIEFLLAALAPANSFSARRTAGELFAIRNLLRDIPAVRSIAGGSAIRALAVPVLGSSFFPVRGILFDKTPGANWKVVWHQDSKIPVAHRIDAPGFRAWSVKAGIVHVEPPEEVLARMLTIRLHLDDCGEENGPLLVKPGSHRIGRLDDEERRRWVQEAAAVSCVVPRGGAVLMRPLLLHASSAAREPGHRRVIHLEFAADRLPGGLEWAMA